VSTPLRRRPLDWLFVGFFLTNLGFITYIVDLEQVVIADPSHFSHPIWPPAPLVDLIHWYGRHYDPLLMARPPFWRMTIWIDVLLFGPFYLAALIAFIKGHNWIKTPAHVWAGMMMANVLILLMEERSGQWATPHWWLVLALNLPWLLMPLAVIARLRGPDPFGPPKGRDPAGPHSGPDLSGAAT
jgi:hypothetical protein